MKKIILSVTMLAAVMFANAQKGEGFSKGNIYVTGGIGFKSTSVAGVSSSSFEFAPALGYFVSNNFAIGAKLGINSTTGNTDVEGVDEFGDPITISVETKENTTSFGVFGRYYFTPANKFTVIGNIGFDYSTTKESAGGIDNPYKDNTIKFAVSPHINYCLSNHFSMEAGFGELGYSSAKNTAPGAQAVSTFGLNLDLRTASFGLTYKF